MRCSTTAPSPGLLLGVRLAELEAQLFGGVEVRRAGRLLPAFPTVKATLLFAYLLLRRDRHVHRETLCALLWADSSEEVARKALRTALWRIRSVVEPEEADRGVFMQVDGHWLGASTDGRIWVDVWDFDDVHESIRGLAPGRLGPGALAGVEQALRLQRAALLEGFHEDWCERERDRLGMAHDTLLEHLVAYRMQQGQWLDAISAGHDLLRRQPILEHVHRAVMRCHLAMGDRASALRQYARCREVLDLELGVEPMTESQHLYQQILDERLDAGAPRWTVAATPSELVRLAAEVDGALDVLQRLAHQLEQARCTLDTHANGGDEFVTTAGHA
jgi:DNA-binding SARP family transcriptional activator